MTNVWTGGGCKPQGIINPGPGAMTKAEMDEAESRHAERRAAMLRAAEEMRAVAEARIKREREWKDQCDLIKAKIPNAEIGPLRDDALVRVERFNDNKPMAAYVLLRTTEPEMPDLPVWYLASEKKHGLKGFFTRKSREQILATHEWLTDEGGTVILTGKVRVLGKAESSKSVHVELVEGFRLR